MSRHYEDPLMEAHARDLERFAGWLQDTSSLIRSTVNKGDNSAETADVLKALREVQDRLNPVLEGLGIRIIW